MICPEDLLDRRGTLEDAERRMLEAHLVECPACALQVELAGAPPVDSERIRHVVKAASAELSRVVVRRRSRWWIALGIAAVLAAGAAAAAGVLRRPTHAVPPQPSPSVAQPTSTRVANAAPEAASIAVEDLPVARETKATTAVPPGSNAPTASELFARANAARRSGDAVQALDLYRKLERDYATSNEAAIAHVSAARLVEKSDPSAALAEYDAYLADAQNIDLREEALGGRAYALERLGRAREEQVTWEELLSKYPDSLRASHARARLEVLRR